MASGNSAHTIFEPMEQEHRETLTASSGKTIIDSVFRDYVISLVVSVAASAACMTVVYALSTLSWEAAPSKSSDIFNPLSYTVLVTLLYVFGLTGFVGVEFLSTFGYSRWRRTKFWGYVLIWAIIPSGLLFVCLWIGIRFWWYYLDVILLVVQYVSLCFILGYLGHRGDDSRKAKIQTGFFFVVVETLVALFTLIYGMILVPYYTTLSDVPKTLWRLLVHPVYFEFLMGVPVRFLVSHQMKEFGVLKVLAVVHLQSHVSTIGRIMLTSFDSSTIAVIAILLLNFGKLGMRVSLGWRDRKYRQLYHFFRRLSFPLRRRLTRRARTNSSAVDLCHVFDSELAKRGTNLLLVSPVMVAEQEARSGSSSESASDSGQGTEHKRDIGRHMAAGACPERHRDVTLEPAQLRLQANPQLPPTRMNAQQSLPAPEKPPASADAPVTSPNQVTHVTKVTYSNPPRIRPGLRSHLFSSRSSSAPPCHHPDSDVDVIPNRPQTKLTIHVTLPMVHETPEDPLAQEVEGDITSAPVVDPQLDIALASMPRITPLTPPPHAQLSLHWSGPSWPAAAAFLASLRPSRDVTTSPPLSPGLGSVADQAPTATPTPTLPLIGRSVERRWSGGRVVPIEGLELTGTDLSVARDVMAECHTSAGPGPTSSSEGQARRDVPSASEVRPLESPAHMPPPRRDLTATSGVVPASESESGSEGPSRPATGSTTLTGGLGLEDGQGPMGEETTEWDREANGDLGLNRASKNLYIQGVNIYTEMVIENCSILVSTFAMWAFLPNRDFFILPLPSQSPSTLSVIFIISMQYGIGMVFDYLSILVCSIHVGVPMRFVWREMERNKYPFFGFLVYGVLFMGVVGALYMAALVPRPMFCSSTSLCTCSHISANVKELCRDLSL